MTKIPSGNIDIDALFNWLEQQPELKELRAEVNQIKCEYRPGESSPEARIKVRSSIELAKQRNSFISRIGKFFWVPGENMRGKVFATPEKDRSLNNTAKVMSFSTIWDFFTMVPIIQFGIAYKLAILSFPVAISISFVLLLLSNTLGEGAMNRTKRNASRASWSLFAFVLICTVKTLFSGPGLDLMISSNGIAEKYAERLAKQKLAENKLELERLIQPDAALTKASMECKKLKDQLDPINRGSQSSELAFNSVYVRAFGKDIERQADIGLTPSQLVAKYGSVSAIPGVCRQQDVLALSSASASISMQKVVDTRSKDISALTGLEYLGKHEPNLFRKHFKLEKGNVSWVNGDEAVAQSTEQFYQKLFAGQFGSLGFSLVFLSVSTIATAIASIMIFKDSQDKDVIASFSGELLKVRDERLNAYNRIVTDKLSKEL